MARKNRSAERRQLLLPRLAHAFAELGYRRTTTAEIARRCRARETTLYRLWPDKRAMFIAAIRYVFELSEAIWRKIENARHAEVSIAERLIEYEATHHGEFGHYRIIFAGLSESDDPQIRAALADVFARFVALLEKQIDAHHESCPGRDGAPFLRPAQAAWAFLGLGTISNIVRDLEIMSARDRERLFREAGRFLLNGGARATTTHLTRRARE